MRLTELSLGHPSRIQPAKMSASTFHAVLALPNHLMGLLSPRLPHELVDHIIDDVESPELSSTALVARVLWRGRSQRDSSLQ